MVMRWRGIGVAFHLAVSIKLQIVDKIVLKRDTPKKKAFPESIFYQPRIAVVLFQYCLCDRFHS